MITLKKLFIFGIIILLPSLHSIANDTIKTTVPKLEINTYGGGLLIHRDAMSELGNHPYFGTEISLGFQTTGEEYWQEVLNYPMYGVGFYSGFFNNSAIGNPFAFYVFAELPFIRRDRFYLSTNLGAGLVFHINEYDSITKPQNIAIGTDLNAYISFSILFKYKINERWEIGTGAKFQHFSNGASKKPNLGLNMLSGQVNLAYFPGRTIDKFKKGASPEPYKKFEFSTMFAAGINAIDSLPDTKHLNNTYSFSASRRVSYKRNVGLGIDVFYNEYIKYDLAVDKNSLSYSDLMSYGVFISSDLIANKFRFTTQIGTYLYRPNDYSIAIYERIALRYYIIPNLFANISIKAHGAKAQFIEWGFGASF